MKTAYFPILLILRTIIVLYLSAFPYRLWSIGWEEAQRDIEKSLEYLQLDQAEIQAGNISHKSYQLFYKSNILIYKFLATYSPTYYQALKKSWTETIEAIEEMPDTDSMRNILLAELYYKRGALEFFMENYFTSVRYIQNSRSLIRKNEQKFPGLQEHKKINGLFNVAFGAVPRKYQWLTNFLGFSGDIQVGVSLLKEAAEQSKLLPMEAELMAYYVAKNMQDQPRKAIGRLLKVKNRMEDNIVLDLCLASGYMGIKENEKALSFLTKRDVYQLNPSVFFIPHWDYLLGKAYYFKQDYPNAQLCFSHFLKSNGGNPFRTDATFRLGMAFTLDGNYPKGLEFFKALASDKSSGFDEDEYADHQAQRFSRLEPTKTIKALFSARNLFDGGYYIQALSILDSLAKQPLNISDKTELYYRYARVFHTQGKLDKASTAYHICIKQTKSEQLWLQVYAHYFLAEIALEQRKTDEARSFYKKALTFDDYFYQDGLENRCKIALAELENN